MLYMNEYDLAKARDRFWNTPNRVKLADVVTNLAMWADRNSDGWASWPAAARAAKRAMEHIRSTTSAENRRQEAEDITDAEVQAALRPIKTFLTRQGIHYSEIIPGAKDRSKR